MRVLHIDLGPELRGGQYQVLLLLNTLRQAGHEVMLLARPGSPLLARAQDASLPVVPASILKLSRLSRDYELVHAHDARAHTCAALASRHPFVVSRRVAFPVKTNIFSSWKYSRPARFLAVSSFVAGMLQKVGVPQSKIDVVYDAVELTTQNVVWNASAPLVALATSDPQKGRDLIEQAARIARLPVTFSHDLQKDLPNASAFVYVSRSEGFGSAALLAMNQGIPLIASQIDGMAEIFEDNISGLAVDNDAASIAAAMRRLYEEPGLAARLTGNAAHRVKSLFGTDALLQRTLDSYRRALAQ